MAKTAALDVAKLAPLLGHRIDDLLTAMADTDDGDRARCRVDVFLAVYVPEPDSLGTLDQRSIASEPAAEHTGICYCGASHVENSNPHLNHRHSH